MSDTYQPDDSVNDRLYKISIPQSISQRPINDLFDVLELDCSETNLHNCYSITLRGWSEQLTKQVIADLLILDCLPVVDGDWHLNRIKVLLENIGAIRQELNKREEWEKSQKD